MSMLQSTPPLIRKLNHLFAGKQEKGSVFHQNASYEHFSCLSIINDQRDRFFLSFKLSSSWIWECKSFPPHFVFQTVHNAPVIYLFVCTEVSIIMGFG